MIRKILREALLNENNEQSKKWSSYYGEFLNPNKETVYNDQVESLIYLEDEVVSYEGERLCKSYKKTIELTCGKHKGEYANSYDVVKHYSGCYFLESESDRLDYGDFSEGSNYAFIDEITEDYQGFIILKKDAGVVTFGQLKGNVLYKGDLYVIIEDNYEYKLKKGDLIYKGDVKDLNFKGIKFTEWLGRK